MRDKMNLKRVMVFLFMVVLLTGSSLKGEDFRVTKELALPTGIRVDFNEKVDMSTVTPSSLYILGKDGLVERKVKLKRFGRGKKLYITFKGKVFIPVRPFILVLTPDIKSLSGKPLKDGLIMGRHFKIGPGCSFKSQLSSSPRIVISKGASWWIPWRMFFGWWTPPSISITGIEPNGTHQSGASANITLKDPNNDITMGYSFIDFKPYKSGTPITEKGDHWLLTFVADRSLRGAADFRNFKIEDSSPASIISVTPEDNHLVSTPSLTITGEVDNSSEVEVNGVKATLNGNNFTHTLTLEEGDNILTVIAKSSGGSDKKVLTVILDSTAPVVKINSPSEGYVSNNSSEEITGTVEDRLPERVELHIRDEVVEGSLGGKYFRFSGIGFTAEGTTPYKVVAYDKAGNKGEANGTLTLDTTAPVITLNAPQNGLLTGQAGIVVRGRVEDNSLSKLTVDGRALTVTNGEFSTTTTLREGNNLLEIAAIDSAGNRSSKEVSVILDTRAPYLVVQNPQPGYLNTGTVTVSGSVEDPNFSELKINGTFVTPQGNSFSLSGLTLSEGENTIEVVALDRVGNSSVRKVSVNYDSQSPEIVSTSPENSNFGVPVTDPLRVILSEEVNPVTVNSSSLELKDSSGTVVPSVVGVDGKNLQLRPTEPLKSGEVFSFKITSAIKDMAGNPLKEGRSLQFTTVDTEAPATPVLGALPEKTFSKRITVTGSSEKGTDIRVEGGATVGETSVDSDGKFSIEVELVTGKVNRLLVTAKDGSGNESAPAEALILQDDSIFSVYDAKLSGDTITISFSADAELSSLSSDSVKIITPSGNESFTPSAGVEENTVKLKASGNLEGMVVNLKILISVKDVNSRNLSAEFTKSFNGAGGENIVTGEVYDDITGLLIDQALVTPVKVNGNPPVEPTPSALSTKRGEYSLSLSGGTAVLKISREGYLKVYRNVATAAGFGSCAFDARLIPDSVLSKDIDNSGGTLKKGTTVAIVPGGAVSESRSFRLSERGDQSLIGKLPYGWSPLGSVDLVFEGPDLTVNGILRVTNRLNIEDPSKLILARFDEESFVWYVESMVSVSDSGLEAAIKKSGSYVFLIKDSEPVSVPVQEIGTPLKGVAAPSLTTAPHGELTFDPDLIYPGTSSTGTLLLTTAQKVASGIKVTAKVEEIHELLTGTKSIPQPYKSDLVAYSYGNSQQKVNFSVSPDASIKVTELKVGEISTGISLYRAGDGGVVVGPEGGTVTGEGGVEVIIPKDSLNVPVAVRVDKLIRINQITPPSGFEVLGGVNLALSGAVLSSPGQLKYPMTPEDLQGIDNEDQLFIVRSEKAGDIAFFQLVTEAVKDSGAIVSARPADLTIPMEGVCQGGTILFLRALGDMGYVKGIVTDKGTPLEGSLVSLDSHGIKSSSKTGGTYLNIGSIGNSTVSALNIRSRDQGVGELNIPSKKAVVNLNLDIKLTAPMVTSMSPASGSTGVDLNGVVEILFSEPIDPVSLKSSSFYLVEGVKKLTGRINLDDTRLRATWTPSESYGSDKEIAVILSTSVKDMNGNNLESPWNGNFRTVDTTPPDADPDKISFGLPDDSGRSLIAGAAGSVDPGTVVVVYNPRTMVTVTLTASSDGSFSGQIEATMDDVLKVTLKDPSGNVTEMVSIPFRSADGKTVVVDEKGGNFTTPEGVKLTLEPDTVEGPVQVTLEKLGNPSGEVPDFFASKGGVKVTFKGGNPKKQFKVSVPAPVSPAAGEKYFLLQERMLLGKKSYMVVDSASIKGNRLENNLNLLQDFGGTLNSGVPLASRSEVELKNSGSVEADYTEIAFIPPPPGPAGANDGYIENNDRDKWNPNLTWSSGYHMMAYQSAQVALVEYALMSPGHTIVAGNMHAMRMDHNAFIPVRVKNNFTIKIVDAYTGEELYKKINEGVESVGVYNFGSFSNDKTAPVVDSVTGGLFSALLGVKPGVSNSGSLTITTGNFNSEGEAEVKVEGAAGTAFEASGMEPAKVRLYNGTEVSEVDAASDGGFSVTIKGKAADKLLLTVEKGNVDLKPQMVIKFSEQLNGDWDEGKLPVKLYEADDESADTLLDLEYIPGSTSIVVTAESTLKEDKSYVLEFTDVKDLSGNVFKAKYNFRTREIAKIYSGNDMKKVQATALNGKYLYVADTVLDGSSYKSKLYVMDMSNPVKPVKIGSPLELGGGIIRAMCMYGKNKLITVGGGDSFFGYLRVIDLSNPEQPVFTPGNSIKVSSGNIGGREYNGRPTKVSVLGDTAFVTVLGSGMAIVNLNGPEPVKVGFYYDEGIGEVKAYQNRNTGKTYAVLVNRTWGLRIIDVTQPGKLDGNEADYTVGQLIGGTDFGEQRLGIDSLEVAVEYPVDLNENGKIEDNEELDIAIFNSTQTGKLYVVDISAPSSPYILGTIETGKISINDLTLDKDRQILYGLAYEKGVQGYNLGLSGRNFSYSQEEKLVVEVPSGERSNFGLVIDKELNLVYTAEANKGVQVVRTAKPSVKLVRKDGEDYVEIERIAPAGTLKEDNPGNLNNTVHVMAVLPGEVASKVYAEVKSLNFEGIDIIPFINGKTSTFMKDIELKRVSDDPLSAKYKLFVSDAIKVSRNIWETSDKDILISGDIVGCGLSKKFHDLLKAESGEYTYLTIEDCVEAGDRKPAIRSDLSDRRGNFVTGGAVADEFVNSPGNNPSIDGGVILHSGEALEGMTDLRVRGRGLEFAFTRVYRSQVDYNGPLGMGWDHNYNRRLIELMSGDLIWFDGSGRRVRFTYGANGYYVSPPGEVSTLKGRDNGFILDPGDGTLEFYSRRGRLGKIADKSGNKIQLFYNPKGQLEEVVDPLGRSVYFEYNKFTDPDNPLADMNSGRLSYIKDFKGRLVHFVYNSNGELVEVDQYGRIHRYDYQNVDGRSLLASYTSPEGKILRTISYVPTTAKVSQQVLNGVTFKYSAGLNATVTDGNNNVVAYKHDSIKNGVALTKTEPGDKVTSFEYDGYNRLIKNIFPEGNAKIFTYLDRSNVVGSIQDVADADRMADAGNDSPTNTTRFDYDNFSKRLQGVTYDNGFSKSFEYNTKGQLIKESDSANNIRTLAYAPESAFGGTGISSALDNETGGYLKSSTTSYGDGAGFVANYGANDLGHPVSGSSNGVGSAKEYNDYDELISERVLAGSQTITRTYERDKNGNVVKSEVLGGAISQSVTYDYDSNDMIESTKDDDGTTSYGYDSNGNVNSIVSPQVSASFNYDSRNLVEGVNSGGSNWQFTYDGNYNPTGSVDPRGKSTTYKYDGYDRMKATVDPLGNESLIQREQFGNLMTLKRKNSAGDIIHDSTRTYDPSGRLTSYVVKNPDGEDISYTVAYDDASRKVTVTDPLGRISSVEKNTKGQVVVEIDAVGNKIDYFYEDGRNNLTKKIETMKSGDKFTTKYKYDKFNRLIEETNNEGKIAYFTYNTLGQLTSSIDFEGNSVSHDYNSIGRKIKTTRYAGVIAIVTDFTYYPNGKLKTITDSKGRVTTYTYDSQQRLETVKYPDNSTKSYTYDLAGNVKTETKRDGTVITNTYDDASRLTSRSIALGGVTGGITSESYTYDGMNRILTATNDNSNISRAYDKVGRLISEIQNGKQVQFGYNKLNSITKLTYPNGRIINRSFDKLNRLKDIKEGSSILAEMEYTGKMSRYLSKTYGNGDVVNYLYDLGKRMKSKTVKNRSNAVVNNYAYSYNKSGMRTRETRLHEGNLKDTYEYDEVYRLTKLTQNTGSANEVVSSVKLDAVDNILQLTKKVGENTETQISEINNLHQYTQFGDWGFVYDLNGNTTRKGTQEFTYNYRNALISHTDPDGVTSFKYDTFGRRITKTIGSTTTNYYYAGSQVIEEYTGSTLSKQYVYGDGIDEIFNVKVLTGSNTGDYYYHTDGIGSTTAITNSNGDIVERVKYSIFGVPTITDKDGNEIANSVISNEYLFQGRRFDKNLNMYYYRARHYDPTTGRFLQNDPLGYIDSLNLYQGMNSNPYNFVDPMGTSITKTARKAGFTPNKVSAFYGYLYGQYKTAGNAEPKSAALNYLVSNGIIDADDPAYQMALVMNTNYGAGFNVLRVVGMALFEFSRIGLMKDMLSVVGNDEVDIVTGRKYKSWEKYLIALGTAMDIFRMSQYAKGLPDFKGFDFDLKMGRMNSMAEGFAQAATQNDKGSVVILGKYNKTNPAKSYDQIARSKKATYFHLKNWNEVQNLFGKENMWKINKAFLKQQLAMGKTFFFSHDPSEATGFFLKEVEFLRKQGFRFIKSGAYWKAVR